MFPFEAGSSFADLDQATRETLVSVLEQRREYATHQAEMSRLRVAAIINPTAENQEALDTYADTYVRPLREGMSQQVAELLKEAIDVEAMKGMLPMILMGLSQSIDIPLALTALGIDPDLVAQTVNAAQEYYRNGM